MISSHSTTLLRLYDRFSSLIEKLPGNLQKPILRELRPIRDLFLDQRPPRIMLIGANPSTVPSLLASIGVSQARTGDTLNGWRVYSIPSGSKILLLDARNDVPVHHIETSLSHAAPDLILAVADSVPPPEEWSKMLQRALPTNAPLAGFCLDSGFQSRLESLLRSETALSGRLSAVICAHDPASPEILCAALPPSAQLEFARFTNARRAQALIASSLLKSFSGACGAIGMQPIPLADLPLLLSLQSLMVGLIIHTTGRRVDARLVGEFLAALGLGAAAGFVFREAARAAVRIVPFWGNAVSGLVAGAGTYAIGRAAIAYFIDDTPLAETRKLFDKILHNRTP